ncbi:MAG TPA: SDR family oxidoreductase [Chloroflexia bacterium]|nr:SDR family oxidoreductase [Chloroflexia bacterium]
MNSTAEMHVILGTGPLGSAVMRELVRRGKQVRLVNRSGKGHSEIPAGVEVVKGDTFNPASVREVTRGASVVYQCSQPEYTEWPEKFPVMQTAIIEGVAANQTKLVVAENLYMYGPVSGPIREDLPYNASNRKGSVRAKMAQDLMEAHRQGKIRATAGRASDFYGPLATLQGAFGDRIIYPMLAGKKVYAIGKIDMLHTYSYVTDFGKGLVVLGEREESLGQAWHIPNAPTITTREMLNLFFKIAGFPPEIGSVPKLGLKALGLFSPMVREVEEMLYEFEEPFLVDHSKFEKAFGNIATPHETAIRETLAWFQQHSAPAKAH